MLSEQTHFTTSEIAEISGVAVTTLYYYERIGLLDPVERLDNGHRRYGLPDVRRLDFLQRLRNTGMSIRAMQHYVALYRQGEQTAVERRKILEAHRARVRRQVDELQETLDLLDSKIERYLDAEHQITVGAEHEHESNLSQGAAT